MKELGYYNGSYGELRDMQVPMNDRACWFGDGVYDAGPCVGYQILALDEHLDRFYRSAGLLGIRVPMEKRELGRLLQKLALKMDDGDLFVYFQVTRGTGLRSHVFPEGPSNLWITMVPGKVHTETEPIRLVTAEDLRYQYCHIKTLNLIPNVLASQKAREAGCQEAVFVRPGGIVTECAHSNIHILRDGILYTHPADHMILPGIARAHLLKACRAAGIPVREEAFHLQELMNADEVIVTSSSFPCMRAGEIDGREAGMRDAVSFYRLHRILTREALRAAA